MRPLAGKRAFYAMGQRSVYPDYMGIWPQSTWPEWARYQFFKGQDHERWSRAKRIVKTWPISKLAEQAQ